MSQTAIRMGHCPQCRKPSVLAVDNLFRPFCSERCKFLDLDGWISGRYVIPVEKPMDQSEDDQ